MGPTDDPAPQPPRQGGPDDPAFPAVVTHTAADYYEGLSIRQYLAGQALARLAGQFADDFRAGGETGLSGAQRCAVACREHADALLAELAKGGG